jgi:hypothetical protein
MWIVAATGESLTQEIAEQCRGYNVLAINDAYRLFPFAKALYASDAEWWRLHKGCPSFTGEKWSTYGEQVAPAKEFGLKLIKGRKGYGLGFSFEKGIIHWCGNSGFAGVNLALHFGAKRIVLVGFDMHGSHFFGEHPPMPRRTQKKHGFPRWITHFEKAAELLPPEIIIINATEGSALKCFPMMSLSEALDAGRQT